MKIISWQQISQKVSSCVNYDLKKLLVTLFHHFFYGIWIREDQKTKYANEQNRNHHGNSESMWLIKFTKWLSLSAEIIFLLTDLIFSIVNQLEHLTNIWPINSSAMLSDSEHITEEYYVVDFQINNQKSQSQRTCWYSSPKPFLVLKFGTPRKFWIFKQHLWHPK